MKQNKPRIYFKSGSWICDYRGIRAIAATPTAAYRYWFGNAWGYVLHQQCE